MTSVMGRHSLKYGASIATQDHSIIKKNNSTDNTRNFSSIDWNLER